MTRKPDNSDWMNSLNLRIDLFLSNASDCWLEVLLYRFLFEKLITAFTAPKDERREPCLGGVLYFHILATFLAGDGLGGCIQVYPIWRGQITCMRAVTMIRARLTGAVPKIIMVTVRWLCDDHRETARFAGAGKPGE